MAQVDRLAATSGSAERPAEPFGRRRVANVIVGACWATNIGLLVAAFDWIYFFGESRETIERLKQAVSIAWSTPNAIRGPSRLHMGVAVFLISIPVALGACIAMFGSLFVGRSRFRTTRMWLVFTTIVCGWLGLVVSWQTVYWFGQQQRLKPALPAADAMVRELRNGWPTADAALPDIGPFLAYPVKAPTALLPLSDAMFPKTGLRFSAVERTGDDVLRFELTGAELGAWLEWRGDGSEPRSFVGGLDSEYVVVQSARLSAEWFLVRYRAAGLVERGVRLSPQVR